MIHIQSILKGNIFGSQEDKKGAIIEVSNEDSESDSGRHLSSSEPEEDFGKKPTISDFKKKKNMDVSSQMASDIDFSDIKSGLGKNSPNIFGRKVVKKGTKK